MADGSASAPGDLSGSPKNPAERSAGFFFLYGAGFETNPGDETAFARSSPSRRSQPVVSLGFAVSAAGMNSVKVVPRPGALSTTMAPFQLRRMP